MPICVVQGRRLQVRGVDGAAVSVLEQSGIDDGGISGEWNVAGETVLEDAGNKRAFGGLADLFFNDRGKGDSFGDLSPETQLNSGLAEAVDHCA